MWRLKKWKTGQWSLYYKEIPYISGRCWPKAYYHLFTKICRIPAINKGRTGRTCHCHAAAWWNEKEQKKTEWPGTFYRRAAATKEGEVADISYYLMKSGLMRKQVWRPLCRMYRPPWWRWTDPESKWGQMADGNVSGSWRQISRQGLFLSNGKTGSGRTSLYAFFHCSAIGRLRKNLK